MNKLIIIFLFFFMISFSSADIFVVGKIYDNNFSFPYAGAIVNVECFSGNNTYTQTATSLSDGTYAVPFTSCTIGDYLVVSAVGAGKKGQDNGSVLSVFQTINVVMHDFNEPVSKVKNKDCDRSPRCGDGKCEGSETLKNCPEDCGSIQISGEILQGAEINQRALEYGVIAREENSIVSANWIILGLALFLVIFVIFFVLLLLKNSF
jgi:hypothetical protein